ncbi:hypothetical protein [Streptomyces sp. NBC_01429]|uniref:hypothetical protein n=1 Tax=Streptomyces sp. NBC_01429 TaxID=2903862 RepID=UPI002E2AE1EC|nr:hypothetical protein [Streptomyces sp. NBC_01429]
MELSAIRPRGVAGLALVDRSPAGVLLHDHILFWQPPEIGVRAGQSCHTAARIAARRWWGLPDAQVARTVGTPWVRTPAAADPGRVERRLLLVMLPPGTPRPPAGPGTAWWPLARLLAGEAATRPAELPAFLDGYLQGVLPDGRQALEW